MGLRRFMPRRADTQDSVTTSEAATGTIDIDDPAWTKAVTQRVRASGGLPYVVEGFAEVSEAVRRGHSVLLPRRTVEVAPGCEVFTDRRDALPGSIDQSLAAPSSDAQLVSVARFEPVGAKFVVRDPLAANSEIALTPRRFATYLQQAAEGYGVAVG